jgi:hypothetical protein
MDLNFYNFTINPVGLSGAARTQYVRQVHEHLRWVHRTTSGRILLNCIRRPSFPVEIRPLPYTACDALGGGEPRAGTWSGVVMYTPFDFSHAGACSALPADQNRGRIWDEMLFHELVHVFRQATGKWNKGPALTFAMRQYTDNEEFIAVMCSNIYVSDRTNRIKSGLRAGHKGFRAMFPADAMRFGLFASSKGAFGLVKQFCADHPIFSKALSDELADVEYNPIADFYRFPKLCEAFSHLGAIKDRAQMTAALTAGGIPLATAEKIVALVK